MSTKLEGILKSSMLVKRYVPDANPWYSGRLGGREIAHRRKGVKTSVNHLNVSVTQELNTPVVGSEIRSDLLIHYEQYVNSSVHSSSLFRGDIGISGCSMSLLMNYAGSLGVRFSRNVMSLPFTSFFVKLVSISYGNDIMSK